MKRLIQRVRGNRYTIPMTIPRKKQIFKGIAILPNLTSFLPSDVIMSDLWAYDVISRRSNSLWL